MIGETGVFIQKKIRFITYSVGYFGKVVRGVLFFIRAGKPARKILMQQFSFAFVESLPIIAVLSISIGTAVHLLGYNFLTEIGQPQLIYSILVLIITRELGPLLTAFILTARSATVVATEIGNMVVSHEIEAYIATGVDPIDYLAVPRFIGITLSLFLLNLYFSLLGLVAPLAPIQLFNPVSGSDYFNGLLQALPVRSLGVSVVKSIVFGMIISIVSTLYGFSVERSATDVPVAGLRAVGISFFLIIGADVCISILSYSL